MDEIQTNSAQRPGLNFSNSTVAYLFSGLLMAASAAYVLWPPSDDDPEVNYPLPKDQLQEPVAAGPGEIIVCATQPMTGATVAVSGTVYKVGFGAVFSAFKVPASSIQLLRDARRENGRYCRTPRLDRSFVSKSLNKYGRRAHVVMKIDVPLEIEGKQKKVQVHAGVSARMNKNHDSGKTSADGLIDDCSNEGVKDEDVVFVSNKECILHLLEFVGYSKPDEIFDNHTFYKCFEETRRCTLSFTHRLSSVSVYFDRAAFASWRRIRSDVSSWLDEHLVYEFSDQK